MIDNYLLKNSSRHNVYVDAREEDPPKRPLGSGTNGPEPKGDDKTNQGNPYLHPIHLYYNSTFEWGAVFEWDN